MNFTFYFTLKESLDYRTTQFQRSFCLVESNNIILISGAYIYKDKNKDNTRCDFVCFHADKNDTGISNTHIRFMYLPLLIQIN